MLGAGSAGTAGTAGGSAGSARMSGWGQSERVVWSCVEVPYLVTHNAVGLEVRFPELIMLALEAGKLLSCWVARAVASAVCIVMPAQRTSHLHPAAQPVVARGRIPADRAPTRLSAPQSTQRLAVWSIRTVEEAPGFVAVTPVRWPAGGPRTPAGPLAPASPALAGVLPTQGTAAALHPGALAQMLVTPPAGGRAGGGGATTYKK